MEKNKNFKNLISKRPPNWKKQAKQILENPWLEYYSSQIARRVILAMKAKDLSQTDLAESIDGKRQMVNRILKGQENLTLKTIYKLSKALNVDLITFPEYEWSKKRVSITLVIESNEAPAGKARVVPMKEYVPRTTKNTATL